MSIKYLDLFARISLSPQIFLEVQRIHGDVFLVTDTVGFDRLIVNPHQRPRANYIVSSVELKCFQTGGTIGTGLKLVKKN